MIPLDDATEPLLLERPCRVCGRHTLHQWPTFVYCGTCADAVETRSVWEIAGIPTITVEELTAEVTALGVGVPK